MKDYYCSMVEQFGKFLVQIDRRWSPSGMKVDKAYFDEETGGPQRLGVVLDELQELSSEKGVLVMTNNYGQVWP